jgi:hypothetical protein
MNFLKETVEDLERIGKTIDDIEKVYCSEFQITKENFIEFADQEYDDGLGVQEMPLDIVILGSDFYMTRHEYDGSENWDIHIMPEFEELPTRTIEVKDGGAMWESLGFWLKKEV